MAFELSEKKLRQLHSLNVSLGTDTQGFDERNLVPTGRDVVVMYGKAHVVHAARIWVNFWTKPQERKNAINLVTC